jgi:hypothetical protein
MGRRNHEHQEARLRSFHETLAPLQQGVAICVLLGNAVFVVTVDGLVVAGVVRGVVRTWRHRQQGAMVAARAGIGPALCGAVAATTIQWVAAKGLIHAVESGRAAVWLERSERWLNAGDRAAGRSGRPE